MWRFFLLYLDMKKLLVLLLFVSNCFYSQSYKNKLEINTVFYSIDTLVQVEQNHFTKIKDTSIIIYYSYYKIIDSSTVFCSISLKEHPNKNNTKEVNSDFGYFGHYTFLKNGDIKIICKIDIFHRTREKFIITSEGLILKKNVPEGMLWFQWRKVENEVLFSILNF